jgi:hypothetical protein
VGSRARYLIVLAEGGSADGRAVYNGPLSDGTLTVGRSSLAEIRMPAQESAIGQHHCRLRIEGNSVWLDTIDHQEVYLDPDSAPSPDESRVMESTELLPSEKGGGRILELGGLSRSAPRADARPTGFGQTRLRVMLTDGPKTTVETPQARASRKNSGAVQASNSITLYSTLVVALASLGLTAFYVSPALADIGKDTSATRVTV